MGASITLAGESLISQKQSKREPLLVSKFVLANVPGLDTTLPVDRSAGVPQSDQIVHSVPVTREGYLATNKVVYSLMLGSDVGDFDFNWIGLVSAEDVLVIAAYVPRQQKRREIPPLQAGNNLTRNIILEYDGAQSLTGINVPASSWQFDFTADFTAINTKIDLLQVEIAKKVDLETWTPPAAVSLDGPVLVYPGSTNTYKITDYNRFSVFTAFTTLGTVSVAADVVTLVVPTVAAAGLLTLDVLRDGNKASFRLPVGAASIVPPTVTSPINLATGVSLDLVLTATAFEVYPAGFDHQVSRRWQIATDEAFTQTVFDKTSTTALTSIHPSDYGVLLQPGKRHYARAIDIGSTLQSANGAAVSFNTATVYIRRPAITSPIDGAASVGLSASIVSDAFSVSGGADIHAASRWQFSVVADFSSVVIDSGWNSSQLTAYSIASQLNQGTQYHVRVKYMGTTLGETEWSAVVTFTMTTQLKGVYKRLTSGASERLDHVIVGYNSKIYMFGGSNSAGDLNDLWQYTLSTDAWAQLASAPRNKRYPAMAELAGKLYVFGGASGGTSYTNDLMAYDIATNVWVTVAVSGSPPVARYNAKLAAVGGKLYMYGGQASAGVLSDLWSFDPSTKAWTSLAADAARSGGVLGVIGNELYYAAGSSNSTAKYTPATNKWTTLPGLPFTYLGAAGGVVGGLLYIWGGYSGGGYVATLSVYSPEDGKWTALPAGPAAAGKQSAAACGLDGKLYFHGGHRGSGGTTDFYSVE